MKSITFTESFHPAALLRLDQHFQAYLAHHDRDLASKLVHYREGQLTLDPVAESELLIDCAKILQDFLAEEFAIQQAVSDQKAAVLKHDPVFWFKNTFVKAAKRELNKLTEPLDFFALDVWVDQELHAHGLANSDRELSVAKLGMLYHADQQRYADVIAKLTQWCIAVLASKQAQQKLADWSLFRLPQKLDFAALVPVEEIGKAGSGVYQGPADTRRHRDGFNLTDAGMTQRQALSEIDYCVYCHQRQDDFCSKGFPLKKKQPELGLKKNPLGEYLTGCPLDEKISEMHVLKKQGFNIGALAMIMIDNPMVPVTGHRICNDCMKGCIYQRQDPVNIPQAETRILTDVLALPWGVEIYDILTRWNPLRKDQWIAKPYNGLKVLVMGMGPAGFTLAHHLLMEGFAVVGTEGLKIEPLDSTLVTEPLCHYDDLVEALDSRVMAGFGGVAEYGITVRWDKNFLKLIYLSLLRRPYFQVFGGVRFGGTLKVDDAWRLGFDHLTVAVGAGLPRELPVPNSMAPGMRQANDFLMALQLTGASKQSSLANLQLRLPVVVIGGGLTAIDAATEAQAYYIAQVEKMLMRYEKLCEVLGEARVRQQFSEQNFTILNELLTHAKAVRAARQQAEREGHPVDLNQLMRNWGGVTVTYRRRMNQSPAYVRNHEEITKALEEGIIYAENLQPTRVRLDDTGHVCALVCQRTKIVADGQFSLTGEEVILPAKSILVATGAKPNIAYEFEHRGTFIRHPKTQYQTYDVIENQLQQIETQAHVKTSEFGAFTSYDKNDYRVTFIGDTHPQFHGSVVKAIASGKRCYPKIVNLFGDKVVARGNEDEYQRFRTQMDELFTTKVVNVQRHSPSVVEVRVKAPLAARNYLPGQFYRVQNFETHTQMVDGTRLQSEAVALLGTKVDIDQGELSLMVLEQGASSRLFALLNKNDPISLMGPTGVRTKINAGSETIVIMGGRLSVAYLLAVAPLMRQAGNRIIYFAHFQTLDEVFCQADLQRLADVIVWITTTGELIQAQREQDLSLSGELVSAIKHTAQQTSSSPSHIALSEVDRVIVVGPPALVQKIHQQRQTLCQNAFTKNPDFRGSIYGPMQCMLKGVCAQCLQWQVDPETGKRTKAVYTCSWQDQPLEIVDIDNLLERLSQNQTQEILTNLWLDYLLMREH